MRWSARHTRGTTAEPARQVKPIGWRPSANAQRSIFGGSLYCRTVESLPGYEKLGYDYVSNVDQRMERAESARARWTYPDDRDDRPRLLIRARSVDNKMVSSLKAKRDDTPVRVNE